MKNFVHAFCVGIFTLVGALPADAATRRREDQQRQEELDKAKQELLLFQQRLEDIRIRRWQDKRNAVAAQEAFSGSWNELKADMDRLAQTKNQKEETILRLQSQEAEKRADMEEQQSRLKQFGLQIREKAGELGSEWEKGFPYRQTERLAKISAFKDAVEKGDPASPGVLEKLLILGQEDFETGLTREIVRDKLTVRGVAAGEGSAAAHLAPSSLAKSVAGYRVRFGKSYQAFFSTEGEDVAILGKTGRLDGKSWDWVEDLPKEVRVSLRKSMEGLTRENAAQGPVLLPMDVLLTKATGDGFTSGRQHGWREKAEREFEGGGWVMWPILLLALVGFGIILEKVIVFLRKDRSAEKLAAEVQGLVEMGRIGEAAALCKQRGGSVGSVLLSVLEQADSSREYAESRAHEAMLHEAPALEKRITTMNILAAASPLVGLLGTVTGMVSLFDVITVHGTSNPKLMAGGISEALIATKWGLGIAIPLLLSYNLLDNWSVRIVSNMEKYAIRLINTVFPGVPKRVEEHV